MKQVIPHFVASNAASLWVGFDGLGGIRHMGVTTGGECLGDGGF